MVQKKKKKVKTTGTPQSRKKTMEMGNDRDLKSQDWH